MNLWDRDSVAMRIFIAVVEHDGLDDIREGDYGDFAKWRMDRCFDMADGAIASILERMTAPCTKTSGCPKKGDHRIEDCETEAQF